MGFANSSLVKVTLDEGRYRRARPLLVGYGVLLLVAAGATAGLDVLALVSAVLIGVYGIAMIAAAVGHRTAAVTTAGGAVSSVVLVIVSAVAAAHHTGGVFAVGLPDVLIFGALGGISLFALLWLHPDQLQGPEWRYHGDSGQQDREPER